VIFYFTADQSFDLPVPSSCSTSNSLSLEISPCASSSSDAVLSSSPNAYIPEFNLEFAETSPMSISNSNNVSVQSSLSNQGEELPDNISPSCNYDSGSQEFGSDVDTSFELDSEITTPTQSEANDECADEYYSALLEECPLLTEPL